MKACSLGTLKLWGTIETSHHDTTTFLLFPNIQESGNGDNHVWSDEATYEWNYINFIQLRAHQFSNWLSHPKFMILGGICSDILFVKPKGYLTLICSFHIMANFCLNKYGWYGFTKWSISHSLMKLNLGVIISKVDHTHKTTSLWWEISKDWLKSYILYYNANRERRNFDPQRGPTWMKCLFVPPLDLCPQDIGVGV